MEHLLESNKKEGDYVMFSRGITLVCCTFWILFFSGAGVHSNLLAQINQARTTSDIYVQQGITQAQVTANAAIVASLQTQLQNQDQVIASLRDEVATQKGIGIGIASVVGLLQVIQVVVQMRIIKFNNGNGNGR